MIRKGFSEETTFEVVLEGRVEVGWNVVGMGNKCASIETSIVNGSNHLEILCRENLGG